jgi:antitoxin MazE
MKVKITKWGSGLGIRLPKAATDALGAGPGHEVELVIALGELRLKPTREMPRYRLEDLIAEMDRLGPENAPELVDWGPDVGAEIIDDEYSRGEIALTDILERKQRSGRRKTRAKDRKGNT